MGILDNYYAGIGSGTGLDPEQQKYAGIMGLLGMASQMLQASGPSPTRQGLGNIMGQGIGGMMQGINTGMGQQRIGEATGMMRNQRQNLSNMQSGISQEQQLIMLWPLIKQEMERRKAMGMQGGM